MPKPFLFSLRPGPGHPAGQSPDLCRVLCLYDNPGEHFDTGADKTDQQTTRHLARSQVLIYLFDPTQDPRFRQKFREATQRELPPAAPSRQETVSSARPPPASAGSRGWRRTPGTTSRSSSS